MNRKLFSVLILTIALLALGSTARAQTGVGDLRGHVYLKQADGTKVPVEGAVIDIYRVDVGGRTQVKSKKDGSFVHAGLQYVATYLISISAPGANPKTQSDVKAGRGVEFEIVLDPGNGRVLTEAEAKAVGGSTPAGGGGGESPEDKAKREAAEAANEKIKAANAKTVRSNEVVTTSFKLGNELLTAGNALAREKQYAPAVAKYDEAIAKYTEGIDIDPEHPGAPSLLTNRALALIERGKNNYNVAVTSTAPGEKATLLAKTKADLTKATEDAAKAFALLKTLEAAGDISGPSVMGNRLAALIARSQAFKYLVTLSDPTKAPEGVTAFEEYIAAELDPIKKAEGEMDLAKMLFDGGDFEKAAVAYQKLLAAKPENLEATYWLGLTLVNIGSVDNNKAKLQEGVNYLQAFADKAPETDSRKAEVKGIVDEMKRSQNVTPQKPTNTRRRGN